MPTCERTTCECAASAGSRERGDGDGGRRGNEKSHTERSTYTRTVHDTRSLLSERVDGDTEQMAATKCNHTERSTVRIRGERPDREN
jgi:hypothetical protein